MVSKPKPTPAATASTSSAPQDVQMDTSPPAPPAAPPSSSTPAPVLVSDTTSVTQPTTPAATPAATAPPAAAPAFGDMSTFLSGEALQSAITNMTEMGFPRDQVLRAMRASYNNADRAVEYLMTGIPAHLEAEAAGPTPPTAAPATQPAAAAPISANVPPPNQPQNLFQLAQQQQQAGGVGPAAAGGAAGAPQNPVHLNLEALRDNPQIQQLRQQLADDPQMAQPLIQQLAMQNPAMAQMLAQNPDALAQLLGVELDEEVPPGAHVVSVTAEERDAIERLEALGFPRQAVLEAYFACDKNEELAANYLFEGGFDAD